MCRKARDAIAAFLTSGKEIGEPDLYYTVGILAPYVRFYALSAHRLEEYFYQGVDMGQIDPKDPLIDEIDDLNDLAEFYMDTLLEAAEETLDIQRDILSRFIISPLFFGEGYEVFFDDETPVISMTATYCWPARIAAKMQVSINTYDKFWSQLSDVSSWIGWGLWDASIWPAKKVWELNTGPLADKIADEVEDTFGPWNEVVVIVHEHFDPVIDDAKAARDAVLGAAEAVGKAAAGTVRMWPWVLGTGAIGLGTYLYFTRDKK